MSSSDESSESRESSSGTILSEETVTRFQRRSQQDMCRFLLPWNFRHYLVCLENYLIYHPVCLKRPSE